MIKVKLATTQPIESSNYWSYPVEELDHILENAEDGDVYLYYQGRLYEAPYLNAKEVDDRYIRSSIEKDYSPSNPWDAPGMSIRDFI